MASRARPTVYTGACSTSNKVSSISSFTRCTKKTFHLLINSAIVLLCSEPIIFMGDYARLDSSSFVILLVQICS